MISEVIWKRQGVDRGAHAATLRVRSTGLHFFPLRAMPFSGMQVMMADGQQDRFVTKGGRIVAIYRAEFMSTRNSNYPDRTLRRQGQLTRFG